jgi:tetratricopeptide (TPR) repeat protein
MQVSNMQQYRVNYPLLIGLIVGTLVCSGVVYGIWKFQIERKSGWLIGEAEKARKEGNSRDAARYYGQYLTINSGDPEIHIKYATAHADRANEPDVEMEELGAAVRILESTVRDRNLGALPEAKKLRRQLAEIYGRVQRFQDALDHVDYLLEQDPNDAELQVLRVQYLTRSGGDDKAIETSYKLIGYDPAADEFDAQKATAPGEVQVYLNLASVLRTKKENPELADRVINQLVEANPDSAEAHLARGRYLIGFGDKEEGHAAIQQAFELQPEDANVLLSVIDLAADAEDYEKAREHVAAGKKLHPDDPRFYQAAADIDVREKKYEAALVEVDAGLKAIGQEKASLLTIFKANLQFSQNDIAGLRRTIDDMKRAGFASEYTDWFAARILLAENKWHPASEALSQLRERIADNPGHWLLNLAELNYFLGLCHERLGRPEMARDQYEVVTQLEPENEQALAGLKRVNQVLGLQDEDGSDPLQAKIAQVMEQPEDQRDWGEVDRMLEELGKKQNVDETNIKVFQAQIMMMREDFAEAAKVLTEANTTSPKNLLVHRTFVQLTRVNPEQGPEKAMELWQKVANQFKDEEKALAELRIDKADILIAMKKDNLRAELAGLLVGIEKWPVQEKIELWGGMAQRYLSLGMSEEARQYLSLAADAQPDELPPRISLFVLALDANDDAGMKEAQEKILEIVKDRSDSTWLYTEARRRLSLVRRGELGKEALDEIRLLVNRAMEHRPGWHELYLVNAELEVLAGNLGLALKHYDEAARRGRPYPAAIVQHIRLLAASGRFADAATQLERLPETLRFSMLGPLYPEVLFRTDKVEDALKQARSATEKDPENPQNHYWYSQLLARSAYVPDVTEDKRKEVIKQAIEAMERVVELQPEFPDAWFALISYHGSQQNMDLAQKTLRDAQLALNGDNLQIFLARSYEALGRWFDAETMYRAYYEAAPDDLARAQQLAAFYLGTVYRQPDKQEKATPLINKILRAGAEGKLDANDPGLHWARRMGARILAATGEYQNMRKAENLLTTNAQGGTLSVEDSLEMASLLHNRPEPRSRVIAVQLLENVEENQRLGEQAHLMLAELYFKLGDWRRYQSKMREAWARFPNSAEAREQYVRKLLARGDQQSINEAKQHVVKLRELSPGSSDAFELTVRLADKLGQQQQAQARAELARTVPNLQGVEKLSDQQLRMLDMFARLFIELDDLDSAEKIYRDLVKRDPNKSSALALFLGLHRGVEQCFETLREMYRPDRVGDVLTVATTVVREKRDEVGDKYDEEIQRWLDAGLRSDPESINLLLLQADLFDLQKRYENAASIYSNLLNRESLAGFRRAVVLNNLAFLIALAGESISTEVDALELVNEAARILGPTSDILDTRAVVWISRGEYKRAIADLELAVTDNPTPSKYFHKAQAHLETGENRAAVESWEEAEKLGLKPESLNRMEYDKFDEVKARIDQIRGPSVTQADGLRRAG